MPGMVPGTGVGPVFQPRVPPPFVPPAGPGSAVPQNVSTDGGSRTYRGTAGGTHLSDGPGPEVARLFFVSWTSPASGSIQPNTSFGVSVIPTSSSGAAMTVQIQSSTSSDFSTSLVTTTLTSQPSGGTTTTTLGPLTDHVRYWLRARSGDGGGVWSEWSATVTVLVDTYVGNGSQYIDENVGVTLTISKEGNEHMLSNVGVNLTKTKDEGCYMYEGDVDTSVPTPVIWCVVPSAGRPGDGVTIYGHGFGTTQATWNAVLEMLIGASWTGLSITSWGAPTAGANAYTGARSIQPFLGIVDVEHQEISVSIPNGAYPPGHQVRGWTNA